MNYINNSAALKIKKVSEEIIDEIEYDEHFLTGLETPLRADAFDISDEEKINKIAHHFKAIMETLGLDLKDDSLKDSPKRVAKMYVKEIFSGLDPKNKPSISKFQNSYKYQEMLVEKNITLHSYCEHHFVPILGVAHIAYISSGNVIGLSKLNRVVRYFSKRPQVQERLTVQIAEELKRMLETEDVAVIIDAEHLCVKTRGIEDQTSSTVTASYHGKFKEEAVRAEFMRLAGLF
jgi:GTP cyclohydrolase IA